MGTRTVAVACTITAPPHTASLAGATAEVHPQCRSCRQCCEGEDAAPDRPLHAGSKMGRLAQRSLLDMEFVKWLRRLAFLTKGSARPSHDAAVK